jgi:hypothetical protein
MTNQIDSRIADIQNANVTIHLPEAEIYARQLRAEALQNGGRAFRGFFISLAQRLSRGSIAGTAKA